MTATTEEQEDEPMKACISDLPNEILEQILCHLSPYRDYKSAMLVCQLWHRIMKGVIQVCFTNFRRSVGISPYLEWSASCRMAAPTISERYSHSACYHNKSMYVFGGCTSSQTTFNDLWRLDLATRQWERPMAVGTYPSPKACASLVSHGADRLVLFGGWSHPTPYPLHQAARFFNQLHVFSPSTSRWAHVQTPPPAPPGKAGHAAAVVRDLMLVFGGSHGHGVSCNELWVLDLEQLTWHKRDNIIGSKPLPRYGHSQITLDSGHMLVIGGCGGPNMLFTDVWMLNLDTEPWSWTEIKVLQSENSPPQLWCHTACKVGDKVVVLSKSTRPPRPPPPPPPPPKKPTPPPPARPSDQPSTSQGAMGGAMGGGMDQGTAATEEEDLEGVVGRVSIKGQYKRSRPETSESSSQESSSDQDENPCTSRRHSYRQFKLPNSPPRGSYRGYAWAGGKGSSGGSGGARREEEEEEGREPSPLSEYQHHRARTKSRSEEVASRLNKLSSEDDDVSEPGTSTGGVTGGAMAMGGASVGVGGVMGGATGSGAIGGTGIGGGTSTSGAGVGFGPVGALGGVAGSVASGLDTEEPSIAPPPTSTSAADRSFSRTGAPSIRPNAMKNRQKQLETLKKYEEKLRNKMAKPSHKPEKKDSGLASSTVAQNRRVQNPMFVHVLDISRAVTDLTVTWLPVADYSGLRAPEETIFYSLVEGRGELVMFGGIQTDLNGMQRGLNVNLQFVSNETHFLEPPKWNR